MSIIKKLEDSIWTKVILAVVVVVIAFAARSILENKHEESKIDKQTAGKTIRETSYAETVPEDDPSHPTHICTVWGKGYKFCI